jgi:hypothetical protein
VKSRPLLILRKKKSEYSRPHSLDRYYGADLGYAFQFFLRIRPSPHSQRTLSPERKNDGRARPPGAPSHSLGAFPALRALARMLSTEFKWHC